MEYVTLVVSGLRHVLNNIVTIKDGLPLDSVRIIVISTEQDEWKALKYIISDYHYSMMDVNIIVE